MKKKTRALIKNALTQLVIICKKEDITSHWMFIREQDVSFLIQPKIKRCKNRGKTKKEIRAKIKSYEHELRISLKEKLYHHAAREKEWITLLNWVLE